MTAKFKTFTKALNNIKSYSNSDRDVIFKSWRSEYTTYLKEKYDFSNAKV